MTRSDLARAGDLIREHVRVSEPETSEAVARVRLIEALARARRSTNARRLTLAVSTALLTAVVVLGLWWRSADETMVSFTVGDKLAQGKVGAYVTPTGNQPLQLSFSDGSVISLEPETRARVTHTTPRGAVVLVETGRARVEIVHRPESEWNVMAGPYTIHVRGTSFDVAFDAGSQTLELLMRSGVVSVEGPGIASPVEIRGAQRFLHSPSTTTLTAADEPARTESGGAAAGSRVEGPAAKPDQGGPHAPASAAPASSAAAESWGALASRGEYRRVLEDAEQRGIDSVLLSVGPDELMALANAARFSGRAGVASRAYHAVRGRFAGTPRAASAAFLLGRMAEGGNPAAAITWYDRYVAEAPAGSFVAEALGRKMIALKRSGNVEAARRAAQAYLQRFPGGPYAGVAREMTTP